MPLDTLIIGAGPAGLSVAQALKQRGLQAVIYEKGSIGEHIYQYPTFMRFHSTRENVALPGLPLTIPDEKPSRLQYVHYLTEFVKFHGLRVRTYSEVAEVARDPQEGLFRAVVCRHGRPDEVVEARTVVVAVGAWEHPRRLNIPGDDLPKVHYRFYEAHPYVGQKVLVVGGRNSALENALAIWRAGGEVTIVHRGPNFHGRGVKYWLAPDMENRIKAGEIRGFLNACVTRIDWETVTIRKEDGSEETLDNDFVIPQIGYHPPVEFLRSLGLEISDAESRPTMDPETFESNIPGLFVAGVIAAGDVSGHIFIENAKHHGEVIAPRIQELLPAAHARSATPSST